MKTRPLSVLVFLIASSVMATDLASVGDVAQNSTVVGGTYVLNPGGNYLVTAPISTLNSAVPGLSFSGNSLTVGSLASTGLLVGGFSMSGGTVNATGGTASQAYGIDGDRYTVAVGGGTLTAQAGTARSAHGVFANVFTVSGGGELIARGGATSEAYGITGNSLTLTDGRVDAASGTASYSRGASFYTTNQSGGTLLAVGNPGFNGNGSSSNAGYFTTNLNQSGGQVEAEGGGGYSVGLLVNNRLTQSGAGSIQATGGSGTRSYGMSVVSEWVVNAGAASMARGTGGSGQNAAGIDAQRITQNGGYLYGVGGSGTNAHGITGTVTYLNGGQLDGQGSDTAAVHGISMNSMYQTGTSILSGRGGDATGAMGINTVSWDISGATSYATVNGGAGTDASGISAYWFTQRDGTIVANGGGGDGANGFISTNSYAPAEQSGGQFLATAGTGTGAHGASVVNFLQTGGSVTATGGGTANAHGMSAATYTVGAGGTTTASGGYTADSYGLYVRNALDVSGTLRLERPDRQAASVFVDAADGVTLRSRSVLAPTVTLTGNRDEDSGLLATAQGGRVVIESGATVAPTFIDHRNLSKGVVYDDYVFIDTGLLNGGTGVGTPGTIDGVFANQTGGLTIQYLVRKDEANGQYLISFERVMDIPEALDLIPCDNARRLMQQFEDLYSTDDALARRVLYAVDHADSRADLNQIATHIGLTLTPQAYLKLTNTEQRSIELMQSSVFQRLRFLARARPYEPVENAVPTAYAALAGPEHTGWEVWASPLYQQSSRFTAKCFEFDSPKEELYGVSAGMSRRRGRLVLAGAFGYLHGTYASTHTDTKLDNYGITLGAMATDLVPGGGWLSPWVSLTGGYCWSDIDQRARGYAGTWKRSDPSAHLFRTSLTIGNDIWFGRLLVTPSLGLDYAYIRQSGFREEDAAGYGLRVYGRGHNSLRPSVGVDIAYELGERLTVGVNARYRYETLDNRTRFTYARLAVPAISLTALGEERNRHSGTLGAQVEYRVNDRTSLAASYDLLLEDGYTASRFSLGLGVAF